MTDQLQHELRSIALALDLSDERSLVQDVLARLDSSPAPATPRRGRRRVIAVVAAGLVAVVAIPGPRHAIANFFGLGSTRIEQVPAPLSVPVQIASGSTAPTTNGPTTIGSTTVVPTTAGPPPVSVPAALQLGQPVTAAAAAERTGLPVPQTTELGDRVGIFVVEPPESGQIIVVYSDRGELALLSTVAGSIDDGLFVKRAADGTVVEFLQVETASGDSAEAVWLDGEPHEYLFQSNDDEMVYQDTLRLASNTLLWQVGDVMYRLESNLPRDEVVRVAGTVSADAVSGSS